MAFLMTQPIPDGLICLTFDDGVKSQHRFVVPLLEELGFGGTFYISEGLRFLEDKTRYMTWEEIADLDARGLWDRDRLSRPYLRPHLLQRRFGKDWSVVAERFLHENADATFAGYTPQRSAAVWVGFPDEQIPMRTQFEGEKVEGGTFPALIWHEIMSVAHDGLEIVEFPQPPTSFTTTTLPEIPEQAQVPDLTGQEMTEAVVAALQDEPNYWSINQVFVQTRDFELGKVFNQIPKPGETVPGGSTITVEIAVAPILPPVPSLVGLTEEAARQLLIDGEFEIIVEYGPDPDAADPTPGTVWSQTPAADTARDEVEQVTIFVNPTPDDGDEEGGDGSGGDSSGDGSGEEDGSGSGGDG